MKQNEGRGIKLFSIRYRTKFEIKTFIVCAETEEKAVKKTGPYNYSYRRSKPIVEELDITEGILAAFLEGRR